MQNTPSTEFEDDKDEEKESVEELTENEYEEKLDEEYGDGDTDHSWPSAGKGDSDEEAE